MRPSILLIVLAASTSAAAPDLSKTIKAIGERCQAAREYAFEGQFSILGQRGSDPAKALSQAKVKLAAAPSGKLYLRVEPVGKDAYVLVSNGQKSWAWVPRLKQYTEEEAAFLENESEGEDSASDSERDLAETFAREVIPILGRIHVDPEDADFHGEVPVKFESRKQSWPLLRVISKPQADKTQTLTQVAFDPGTLAVGRMVHSTVLRERDVKTVIQMNLDFSTFQIGAVDRAVFEFEPPKGAKLVDTVPIPGQTGSFLLHQPAPDFELKTLEGDRIRLAELRGRPVLLSFWASWCGPCRRELPALADLYDHYKAKGLLILGVNDEGKGTARKFSESAGLNFQTLDDSGLKVHRLYRVHSVPTLFLIDQQGTVKVFLSGAKDPEKVRAALATVGL